ncbi:MAG: hypothetical protein AAFR61_08790 [Bacteroidota bacterium]
MKHFFLSLIFSLSAFIACSQTYLWGVSPFVGVRPTFNEPIPFGLQNTYWVEEGLDLGLVVQVNKFLDVQASLGYFHSHIAMPWDPGSGERLHRHFFRLDAPMVFKVPIHKAELRLATGPRILTSFRERDRFFHPTGWNRGGPGGLVEARPVFLEYILNPGVRWQLPSGRSLGASIEWALDPTELVREASFFFYHQFSLKFHLWYPTR